MHNPYNIFIKYNEMEGYERPTITRTAERIGVTPKTLYSWLTGKTKPRKYHIGVLARHLQITEDEVLALIKRTSDIAKAGYDFPFGCMVTWDMFTNSHKRLLNGEDPFPLNTSIYDKGRIEYD